MNEPKLAKDILDNPMFEKILDYLKYEYFEQWAMTPNVEEREKLYLKVEMLEDFKSKLTDKVLETSNGR